VRMEDADETVNTECPADGPTLAVTVTLGALGTTLPRDLFPLETFSSRPCWRMELTPAAPLGRFEPSRPGTSHKTAHQLPLRGGWIEAVRGAAQG
jgi:hypothetical protein